MHWRQTVRFRRQEEMRRLTIEGRPVELFPTSTGNWWLPVDDLGKTDPSVAAIICGQVCDPAVVEEARLHIKPGTVVLDLGSNFGQMAVLFSKMTGPDGAVHAFEANPFVAAILRMNRKENGAENIVVHECAVWHRTGDRLVYEDPVPGRFRSYGSYGITPNASNGHATNSQAIDDLAIEGPISFIKVDVQGSDLFAMMGARKTICASRAPVIFEFESLFQEEFGTSLSQYMDFVESIGYCYTKNVSEANYLIEKLL